MSGVEQRARFEAWAKPFGYPLHRRDFPGSERQGQYGNAYTEDAWQAWQAALASQAQVPDGYVLVPREPTDAMLDSANGEKVGGNCYYCSQEYASYGDANRVWAAMLAAAPAPEVSGG